jgi:hypothetical protein
MCREEKIKILSKKKLTRIPLIVLSLALSYLLNSVVMQGSTQENPQRLEKLPFTFDFDGPPYPKPSLAFGGPFPNVPKTMMIYKVKDPNITEISVRQLAKKFGIPADAELKRTSRLGLYWLKTSSQHLEVDPSNGSFNIRKIREKDSRVAIEKNYPSKEDCETIAKEYLKNHNLLSKDVYFRGIADNTDSSWQSMSVGFGRNISGYKTWGAGGEFLVEIGPSGEIVAVRKAWQEIVPYKPYPIKNPQEALEELRNTKGVLMHGCEGKVNQITLRYYTSPQKQTYVQPIYYFECTGAKGDFYGVVPAIKQEYLKSKEETIKEIEKKGK